MLRRSRDLREHRLGNATALSRSLQVRETDLTCPTPTSAPVASNERVHALAVVRGIAVIGIFLMMHNFVQDKFWTI